MTGIFPGTIIVFLADTLGAHQVGGFKVGVGFSLWKCRECMATREDIQSKVLLVFLINLYGMYNFQFTENDVLLRITTVITTKSLSWLRKTQSLMELLAIVHWMK